MVVDDLDHGDAVHCSPVNPAVREPWDGRRRPNDEPVRLIEIGRPLPGAIGAERMPVADDVTKVRDAVDSPELRQPAFDQLGATFAELLLHLAIAGNQRLKLRVIELDLYPPIYLLGKDTRTWLESESL